MDKFYTYIYYDPLRNHEPIYVGKGHGKRAWVHLYSKQKHPFIQRLEYMKKNNTDPMIGFYSGLDEECSLLLEQKLISKFGRKDRGKGPLLNLTDGGELGANKSAETRMRMSANNLGKQLSVETKAKMSASRKGIVQSDLQKLNNSIRQKESYCNGRINGMKNKSHSEETKMKMRLANTGNLGRKRMYKDDGSWIMVKVGK